MTATTETREPEMGLTFEKVWAMFQESDRRMQKLNEETAQQMRETDRKIQEVARRIEETDRQMKETGRQMKQTDVQIGKLGNRFGELAEHLVAPNIIQKFNALGFHFDDISGLRRIIKDEGSGQK
ncbi:MAG: hypothetical protein LBO82_08580, partial [Synergistaceae bacterium]|nr:hypothetical protein [Synergistaceae bacterium]